MFTSNDYNTTGIISTPTAQNDANLLTMADVVARLRVGKSRFYELCAQGKGPRRVTIGKRCYRFRRDDVEAWLTKHSR